MDILNEKKGRVPLQYIPEELNADEMSDDEYDVLTGNLPDFLEEKKIIKKTDELVTEFCNDKNKNLSTKDKLKQLDWIKHLSITNSVISLEGIEIEDDFKRESAFLDSALTNLKKCLEKIEKNQITLGRASSKSTNLFNDFLNPKKNAEKPKKLKKKKHKKQKEFVYDDDAYEDDPQEIDNNKKHARREFYKYKSNSQDKKLKKKRPGKRARDSRKSFQKE